MSLQLAAASYIYTYYALRKREKSGGGGKGNSTQAGKCTAVRACWQIEFSVGQWVI
jgi:hypothetical protein